MGAVRVVSGRSFEQSRVVQAVVAGGMVSIAYYVGAKVGLALTLAPEPVSTLWPPNAILLSALLLTPPRWWPALLLLAVLPAHLFSELSAGIPLPMVLGWFLSNSAEALIGAAGFRFLVAGPLRLDTARQVAAFLVFPVFLAPFLSSFLDAGLVVLNRFGDAGYWEVWRTRFFSNMVAALTLIPVIVIVGGRWGELSSRQPRRLLEGLALAISLIAVCWFVFAWWPAGPQTNPALLYAPLPLLLWAAVRFGPAGVSASLLVFALIAIGGATRGLGPFITSSPRTNALAMQEFLIIISVPLLALTAVMQERAQAERNARRSQDSLRLALRAAQMGTWEWLITERRGVWSADTRAILGITGDEQVRWTSLLRQVLPEDWPQLVRCFRRQPHHDRPYELEFRIRRADGSVRWVRANAIALSDGEGPPTRVLGVTADITERMQTLETVRESEARFRGVFELGIMPMTFWHADGRITDANDAFLRMVERTREEVQRGELFWSDLTATESRELDEAALDSLKATGSCAPYEKEYVLRDGRRVPVLIGAALLGPDYGICVEMDLTELKRVERELEDRLQFERLVGGLLTTFATETLERAEEQLPSWMGRLGDFMGAERVALLLATPNDAGLRAAYSWSAPGLRSAPLSLDPAAFPYLSVLAGRGEPVGVESLADLPPEAAPDRERLARLGVGALLEVPILLGGELFGVLVLTHGSPWQWPADAIPRLRGVGEIFANILARKVAEGERRTVEVLNSAVLASLPGTTAILDRDGTIVRFSGDSQAANAGLAPAAPPYLGRNYLELCRERCEDGDNSAAGVHTAVASVLRGEVSTSVASYAGYSNRGKLRWYEIWIARLARREGGAVLTAFDVTARKEAELEAARNRDDLAHLVRVVTMGELAASFAHELKQPLTAIMANAQAGRRILDRGSADPGELHEILSDIVRDNRRASDVLQRTSALLRKGQLELQPLDLNELVRDVLGFLHSDLLLHQVETVLELSAFVPPVRGDRIHLQQVMLNVILNAVDALEHTNPGIRRLTIRTIAANGDVRVSITDNGPGIPPDKLDRVFDAFYSTKASGLGMGLSIARTILAAHGGRVWASNNAEGGATLQFGLPAIQEVAPESAAPETAV